MVATAAGDLRAPKHRRSITARAIAALAVGTLLTKIGEHGFGRVLQAWGKLQTECRQTMPCKDEKTGRGSPKKPVLDPRIVPDAKAAMDIAEGIEVRKKPPTNRSFR